MGSGGGSADLRNCMQSIVWLLLLLLLLIRNDGKSTFKFYGCVVVTNSRRVRHTTSPTETTYPFQQLSAVQLIIATVAISHLCEAYDKVATRRRNRVKMDYEWQIHERQTTSDVQGGPRKASQMNRIKSY